MKTKNLYNLLADALPCGIPTVCIVSVDGGMYEDVVNDFDDGSSEYTILEITAHRLADMKAAEECLDILRNPSVSSNMCAFEGLECEAFLYEEIDDFDGPDSRELRDPDSILWEVYISERKNGSEDKYTIFIPDWWL